MSKILEASCVGGVVSVDGLAVANVEILSEGVATSEGFLIIDEEKAYYVSKTSLDLKTTLDKSINSITDIAETLTQIATTLVSIGAGMTGPTTAPPPTLAADVITINSKVTLINAAIAQLTTLKDNLK